MKKVRHRRLFLLSNMYPSEENVRYGIFVKRFEESIAKDFELQKIVLTKKNGFFSKVLGYLGLYAKVIRLVFQVKKNDIVYIHFPLYFSPFLAPLFLREAPIILNFHGNDAVFETALKKFLAFWLKLSINKCSKIVVPSQYYKERIQNIFNLNSDKIHIYPSGGIDSLTFYPINKKENTFIFGFVSNFIEKKGWRIFLEALTILLASPNAISFKAIMVGDGPDLEDILAYIKEKNLDVEVINSVNQADLAKIYAKFDVFIFPTFREQESLGLVGLEALMCGIPVIASKMAGPMGYIKEDYNGYFFKKENSEDLAQKMIKFQNLTKEKSEIMKQNAVESVKDYEKRKVSQELLEMLNSIVT